jgi:hypothetical protein
MGGYFDWRRLLSNLGRDSTRDIFVVLLRVVIGTGVITSETIDCWHNNKRAHSRLNSREAADR